MNANLINMNNKMTIIFIAEVKDFDQTKTKCEWEVDTNPQEALKDLFERFFQISGLNPEDYRLYFNQQLLSRDSTDTVAKIGLTNKSKIVLSFVILENYVLPGPMSNMIPIGSNNINYKINQQNINVTNEMNKQNQLNFKIYIKFIRFSNYSAYNAYKELSGLLKLCLVKEIAVKTDMRVLDQLRMMQQIPEVNYFIMKVLKESCLVLPNNEVKTKIKGIMEREDGRNLLKFSNFVDGQINSSFLELLLRYMQPKDINDINDIRFRLGKYDKFMPFFESELNKHLKNSVFEFSVVSLVILDRQDFDRYANERAKCPNRCDLILYHGTQIHPISCILTGLFKRSQESGFQHGKGVYFTDSLDYCWFYGGNVNNRANRNKIPNIGDTFTSIISLVYFDRKGFLPVSNYNTRLVPGKNQINFAYANSLFETVQNPDYRKFVGTEFVVWDLDQICPFVSVTFRREEYCVIWRDNNFSSKPVYNNEYDAKFKQFLQERMKYIKESARYNIYPCESTEEALKLVNRKKYNKIILMSNVGTDLGGKKFVDAARQIIGNNVIVLFLAYNTNHLNWIVNYKNALFSNDPKFYEEYLDCFTHDWKFNELINKLQNHYGVRFNIDNTFLYFPHYRTNGNYSDLTF